MSLDNGFRSKCCKAHVRIVRKKIKGAKGYSLVYQCLSCLTRNVDIIPKEDAHSQVEEISFAGEED